MYIHVALSGLSGAFVIICLGVCVLIGVLFGIFEIGFLCVALTMLKQAL